MKLAIVSLAACLALGCSNAATPVAQSNNSVTTTKSPEKSQTAIAHSSENQTQPQAVPPASGEKSKWTASGDPIDTKAFDSAIASAEKAAGGKPSKALGDAYYKRAVALTEARQYASALGDYRRALKNDPANAEAKDWVDKIIMIYDGLNKSSPKEGEEPPPLPFKKS
jgi:tetratricopeptide (TPR) repeat protein